MTTLAGSKIKRHRLAQRPKQSRASFGERYGLPDATVLGLEERGKRPRDADVVNKLARDGVAVHADWYLPARCADCALASDDPAVADCAARGCPLAERRVA